MKMGRIPVVASAEKAVLMVCLDPKEAGIEVWNDDCVLSGCFWPGHVSTCSDQGAVVREVGAAEKSRIGWDQKNRDAWDSAVSNTINRAQWKFRKLGRLQYIPLYLQVPHMHTPQTKIAK